MDILWSSAHKMSDDDCCTISFTTHSDDIPEYELWPAGHGSWNLSVTCSPFRLPSHLETGDGEYCEGGGVRRGSSAKRIPGPANHGGVTVMTGLSLVERVAWEFTR